jgi:hypothetical protein
MKTTVYLNEFRNYFNQIRPDNFTYEGLEVLYDYLLGYEDSTGEEIDLDVIALCCDYCESTYEQIAKDYGIGEGEDLQPEDIPQAVIDYLNDNTTIVGELEDGKTIIYQNF